VRPAGIKSALRRRIGDASRRLRAGGAVADAQVHEARKDLKRARAGLRLLRDIVGRHVYERENAALRDAARPLGAVRDAKVIMDTLEKVFGGDRYPSHATVLHDLRIEMERGRHDARQALHDGRVLPQAAAALQKAWTRIDRWRLSANDPASLARGVERLYRRGRKALARAERQPTADNLHEWRKQVKYLGHALEMLDRSRSAKLGKLVKRAEAAGSALGDDHDLVVLHERIAAIQGGSHNAHRALSSEIEARRKRLQAKAFGKGRALYKLKPQAFVKRVAKASGASASAAQTPRRKANRGAVSAS
jgi:CHAD domain-containing protein